MCVAGRSGRELARRVTFRPGWLDSERSGQHVTAHRAGNVGASLPIARAPGPVAKLYPKIAPRIPAETVLYSTGSPGIVDRVVNELGNPPTVLCERPAGKMSGSTSEQR